MPAQAFNVNPASRSHRDQQWVPATILLAGDHLVHLIVKNAVARDKASQTPEERFARAVWGVHASVFSSYEDQWCRRMKLPARLRSADQLAEHVFSDPHLVHGLLAELALWFLIYTEVRARVWEGVLAGRSLRERCCFSGL